MEKLKILVLNGPNLNMLGKRNPAVYGSETLQQVVTKLENEAKKLGCEILDFQSNSCSELTTLIQQAKSSGVSGIIFNAGGLTHYAWDLRDAVEIAQDLGVPTIEVHISNIHKRESFRHVSVFSAAPTVVIGQISGLGTIGYVLALNQLVAHIKKTKRRKKSRTD